MTTGKTVLLFSWSYIYLRFSHVSSDQVVYVDFAYAGVIVLFLKNRFLVLIYSEIYTWQSLFTLQTDILWDVPVRAHSEK